MGPHRGKRAGRELFLFVGVVPTALGAKRLGEGAAAHVEDVGESGPSVSDGNWRWVDGGIGCNGPWRDSAPNGVGGLNVSIEPRCH
jgi:hypothetical protein